MTDLWNPHSPVPDRPGWYFGSVRRTWLGGECQTDVRVYRSSEAGGVAVADLVVPIRSVGRAASPDVILASVLATIDRSPHGVPRPATFSSVDPDA